MGSCCFVRQVSYKAENDPVMQIEDIKQRKIILMYLMEKLHKLKTEESRNRVNEQLKETFNCILAEIPLQEEHNEEKAFAKNLNNYQKMFNMLKIDCYGLLDCLSYTEFSRKIVIDFYSSILLKDKSFTDRYSYN